VFITAYHQLDYALAAIKLGASGFVLKPIDPEEIIQACKKAKQLIDEERARIAIELGLRNQVKAFSFTLQDMLVSEKEVSKWSEVTLQIMHYIELNYIHEMNITVVAETLHYHPDYLSRLFKKETGENFSDTLTRFRMKKAIDQ
jgi:two-component system response regulator YesN